MKEGAKFAQAAKTFKHSEVKSINFRILCVLRNTMLLNFLHSRKFLGCQLVSCSVLAWRAANKAVITFRPFSVTT